jgi:putative transposon-encoded protein
MVIQKKDIPYIDIMDNFTKAFIYLLDIHSYMSRSTIKMDKMSFETTVRPFGNTGHITLPLSLVGKKVKVTVEVI